jgi:hypothetical protein
VSFGIKQKRLAKEEGMVALLSSEQNRVKDYLSNSEFLFEILKIQHLGAWHSHFVLGSSLHFSAGGKRSHRLPL